MSLRVFEAPRSLRPIHELGKADLKKIVFDTNPIGIIQQRSDRHRRSNKSIHDRRNPQGWREGIDYKPDIVDWLVFVTTYHPRCYNLQNHIAPTRECGCLAEVDKHKAAEYLVKFYDDDKKTRQVFFKSQILAANGRPQDWRKFHLPFGTLCTNSFKNLFCLRSTVWNNLRKGISSPGPSVHGNTVRQTYSQQAKAANAIVQFLDSIVEKEAEPGATRLIKETTRKSNTDLVELPSSYSKRGLFKRFLYEQGYIVQADAKGSFGAIRTYKKRQDEAWGNRPCKAACDFAGFVEVWKSRRPLIRIKSPSRNTCSDSDVLANSYRYQEREREEESQDLEATAYDDAAAEEKFAEQLLFWDNLYNHIGGQKEMRELIELRQEEARRSYANNPNDRRQKCFAIMMDYAQDLDLPHFGGEQSDITFHYSPMSVYIFGIVDLGLQEHKLNAYCYPKGKANKDAASVASMMDDFVRKKSNFVAYDDEQNPIMAKRLSIIACDNGDGQNKNITVIKMAAYYVERGYFEEVEILFFARGHTRNACDRLFNLMKNGFRKKSVYTFDSDQDPGNLVNTLNMQEHVTVVEAKEDMFRDWDKTMNNLYRTISDIQTHHLFRVTKPQAGRGISLEKRKYAQSAPFPQPLSVRNRGDLPAGSPAREVLLQQEPRQLTAQDDKEG